MAFWKKSADPWDIDPDQRRTASEPAEKAPGLLDTCLLYTSPSPRDA